MTLIHRPADVNKVAEAYDCLPRNYSRKTVAILFGLSGNRCAHPDCDARIIVEESQLDPDAIVGHIAHIYSITSKGPRPYLNGPPSKEFINGPENLILLCRHHHGVIDQQEHTYSADVLLNWKENHYKRGQMTRRSYLPSRFHSFRSFGRSLNVFAIDATLKSIGYPEQRLERVDRNGQQEIVHNVYWQLWFERDDGAEFSIKLKNIDPPGREGTRFTILAAEEDRLTTHIFFGYNHSTRGWYALNSFRGSLDFTPVSYEAAVLLLGVLMTLSSSLLSDKIGASYAYGMFSFPLCLGLALGMNLLRHVRLWRFMRQAASNLQIE